MSVLRPHEPPHRKMYPLEDDPATLHYAVTDDTGEVVAVGSAMPDPHPVDPRPGDWRVRGMATGPERRGEGLGGQVLARLELDGATRGARRIWCNARSGARSFYEHAGYTAEGEEFEIPGIGPHFLMAKPLR